MADHPTAASAAATEAFRRVCMLAAEHRADLDQPVRLMHTTAWAGGGAQRFATDLGRQRTALQAGLAGSLEAVADLIIHSGGTRPPVPQVTTSLTTMTSPRGRFQGIEPAAMTTLISGLHRVADDLTAAGVRLARELAGLGLAAQPGRTLATIGEWARQQSGDLRRRLTRIQETVADRPMRPSLVAFDLFGAHAGDPGQTSALLTRIGTGDATAVLKLLAVQETATDPGLAARINAWWHALPAERQAQLIDLARFGALNGLPARVRDQANRRFLAHEKVRLTRALDAGTADLLRLDAPWLLGGWERTSHQLQRIDSIEQALTTHAGHPPPLLLGFDLDGLGRLIVSWGDPDTADITVTSVSGLASELDTAAGDLERSRALWHQAASTAEGRSLASITWYGYDAPQIDPGLLDPRTSVAFDNAAGRGGTALAAFGDGLHASHEPSGTARGVMIGHSYGSLTVGKAALLRPGTLTDEFIFLGSPGVGVEHARDLGVRPEHVWVGEAGNDPVAYLGRFGADPGDDAFGAQRFPVGRTVIQEAHGSYWDPQSISLRNLGRIINGQYEKITYPRSLNEQNPQLLMPELAPDLALQSEG
jgi:hypothetical protein